MNKQWILFLLPVLMFSCTNAIKKEIEQIQSKMIEIPVNEMTCWKDGVLVNSDSTHVFDESRYKYIVYIDSSLCSTCSIEQLYHWNEFIHRYEFVDFYFILAPKNVNDAQILPTYLNRSELEQVIFIDANYSFLQRNPHIANSYQYNCMLLNPNNEAIIIGNPVSNPKIESLLSDYFKKLTNNETQCE